MRKRTRIPAFLLAMHATALLAGSVAVPSRAHAQAGGAVKIGFVDLEYALNNVEEGRKAKAILNQDFERRNKELEENARRIQQMREDLKGQALLLPDEARRQKEAELLSAEARYEADLRAAREAWQKKEASLTRDLLERLTGIVQQIGKEGSYTFILERHDASVLYARENVDLTREVIERFNKTGGR